MRFRLSILCGTHGETEKGVRLYPVGLRLDIFVARSAGGHDDPFGLVIDVDPEAHFSGFDALDRLFLSDFPAPPVTVFSPDKLDSFMGTQKI